MKFDFRLGQKPHQEGNWGQLGCDVSPGTHWQQTKEKWGIIGTILVNNREIPVYSFVKARFNVNNKMSNYLTLIRRVAILIYRRRRTWSWKSRWKCDVSKNQTHSTQNHKDLIWLSLWQTTIGSPNTAEKYTRPNRGTRCNKIDLRVSKVWTLGKQLTHMNLSHSKLL